MQPRLMISWNIMLATTLALAVLGTAFASASSSSSVASEVLSPAETGGLLFMREEEKLARDVYVALGEQWGLRVFTNIAVSEQTHFDQMGSLLNEYGLDDPAAETARGEFVDPSLQALYDELLTQGSMSLEGALRAGAYIEEIDIVDLETRLDQTTNPDIERVYGSLLKGSRNHLRAFDRQLSNRGISYQTAVLEQSRYDLIAAEPMERGSR